MRKRAATATAAATKGKGKAKGKAKSTAFPSPISAPSSNLFEFDTPFAAAGASTSAAAKKKSRSPTSPFGRSPSPSPAVPRSVSDLKATASSGIESFKRHIDACHSDALKELEASNARISKRFKIQKQACLQSTEDADKEYKKIVDKIAEHAESIKASYAELMTDVQATTSRVCKVTIPELAQSMEKAVEGLRSRHRLPVTPV